MEIDFEPDRTMYPFESKRFDSSAGRMHYIDEGSGTPILFCHGNPTWSFLYVEIHNRNRLNLSLALRAGVTCSGVAARSQ